MGSARRAARGWCSGLVAVFLLAGAGGAPGASASQAEMPVEVEVVGLAYAESGHPAARGVGRLVAKPGWSFGSWGEARGRLVGNLDTDEEFARRLVPDWGETDPKRRALQVEEHELGVHLGRVDMRAGKVLTRWGVAEGVRAADVLAPLDLTDPLDTLAFGIPGVVAEVYLGEELRLTAAALRHAPHRLPQAGRRWFPLGSEPAFAAVPAAGPRLPRTVAALDPVRLFPGGLFAWGYTPPRGERRDLIPHEQARAK